MVEPHSLPRSTDDSDAGDFGGSPRGSSSSRRMEAPVPDTSDGQKSAYAGRRSTRFLTFETCHLPPRAVRTPRLFSTAAKGHASLQRRKPSVTRGSTGRWRRIPRPRLSEPRVCEPLFRRHWCGCRGQHPGPFAAPAPTASAPRSDGSFPASWDAGKNSTLAVKIYRRSSRVALPWQSFARTAVSIGVDSMKSEAICAS